MPYANENEAKEAGFPTEIDGVALTIEQINQLAEIFDELQKEQGIEAPMEAAVRRFRELYEIREDRWVAKESEEVRMWGSAEVKNNLRTSAPPHPPTSFHGIISLSAVSLPDGGLRDNRIPDQIILHTGTWRGGEVEITGEILAGMLDNHIVLSDKSSAPYLEPFVKADHSLSVNDIIGHWENLRVEEVEIPTMKGALEVTALVGDEVITNPEALAKIARGEWTRRSAEFVKHFRDDATGEEFDWVLLGSAYVDIPEITSIPPVRVPIAAASTLEEAIVELKKVHGAWCVVRGAEKEKKKSQKNDILESQKNGEAERLAKEGRVESEAHSVEMRKLREDCENLRRESAQRQEEIRGLRRERRLEELRRPGENGLALPESTIALVREGMEKFATGTGATGTATGAAERVKLGRGRRRGEGETHSVEEEMEIGDFIVVLAKELRDAGLVDMRVLTALDPRFDDDERKAEKIAKERGYIEKDGKAG